MKRNRIGAIFLAVIIAFGACQNDRPVPQPHRTPATSDTSALPSALAPPQEVIPAVEKPMTPQEKKAFCQQVFDLLWEASDHHIGKTKPPITISGGKINTAGFIKNDPSIFVEEKAFNLCLKMGPSSFRGALAFLIAHELAHYFQHVYSGKELLKKTGFYEDTSCFLCYNAVPGGYEDEEENADLSGAFNVYLANIPLDSNLLTRLISNLYDVYGEAKNAKNYLTKEERQRSTQKVGKQLHQLIALYEAAPFFSAVDAHTEAVEAYSTILLYYRGKEVYMGRAVAYARRALSGMSKRTSGKALKPYIFPLETDWETRLRPQENYVNYNAPADDLSAAAADLAEALNIDPNYELAALNALTVKVLRGYVKPDALRFSDVRATFEQFKTRFGEKNTYYPQALMSYALAHALSPGKNPDLKPAADSMFNAIVQKYSDEGLKAMAQHNLAVLNSNPLPKSVTNKEFQNIVNQSFKGIDLPKDYAGKPNSILLRSDVKMDRFFQNGAEIFVFEHKKKRVVLQRIKPRHSTPLTPANAHAIRLGTGGGIHLCPNSCGFRALGQNIQECFRYHITHNL